MRCKYCRQANVDGALNQYNEYICVDCWVQGGTDALERATVAIGAVVPYEVDYPADMRQRFLDGLNEEAK